MTAIAPSQEAEEKHRRRRARRAGFLGVLLRTALKRKDFQAGLAIVAFFVALAGVSLVYLPFNPLDPVGLSFQPPNQAHWFGTTNIGQDVFSQWMYGSGQRCSSDSSRLP